MRSLVEKQLSWLALLLTAFYSLLASCKGEECGQDELMRCARPLQDLSPNNFTFVMDNKKLLEVCPKMEASTKCVKSYSLRCMGEVQRAHFNQLYAGINTAIMELCQEGPYQDRYLKLTPCLQSIRNEYQLCHKRYQENTSNFEVQRNLTKSSVFVKSVCCSFKEYLDCVQHTVRRKCGDESAEFVKDFFNRMSDSLMQTHCAVYTDSQCGIGSGSSTLRIEILLATVLLVVARYFT